MADTAREASSELARLKDLLLRPEANRLESLQAQVSALDERVGTNDRLENATAEILVDAFRQAEGRQHRELARAIAPVVVAAIQSEIRNSRDMMVEALYPITGRLVAAAVADAFRTLVTNINQRADTMMSMRLWKLRLKSWFTRRPLSELLLAEASRPHLRRLLFLERGSGTLLGSWADEPGGNDRSDLVSGMIAAITEFSSSVFKQESGQLRTIDMGASRIVLHASARSIIAGEFTGPLHPQDEIKIHETFARLAGQRHDATPINAGEIDDAALALAAMAQPAKAEKSSTLGIWIIAALAAALLGYFGWRSSTRANFEHSVRAAFAAETSARPHMQAYPLNLSVDHGARQITLSGLAPGAEDADAVRKAVQAKAGEYALGGAIAIVVSQEAAIRSIEQMHASLDALQAGLQSAAQSQAGASRELSALQTQTSATRDAALAQAQSLAALQAQAQALAAMPAELEKLRLAILGQQPAINDANTRIGELSASFQARIETLQTLASDPRIAAERFISRSAIFFERDAIFRDRAAAEKTLDELVRLLRAADMGVRVIAYVSESGSVAANQKVAQERTRIVTLMLGERGIDLSRVVTAYRANGNQIDSKEDGPAHANRRVAFETLFDNEKPP